MKENKANSRDQKDGTMLNQKTNEDHNKQQPDPKNPNQVSKKAGEKNKQKKTQGS
jgi:hypothetical protein